MLSRKIGEVTPKAAIRFVVVEDRRIVAVGSCGTARDGYAGVPAGKKRNRNVPSDAAWRQCLTYCNGGGVSGIHAAAEH
jgi:hypothetical protein